MFQSLLHQGISLLTSIHPGPDCIPARVSIPSSSGHQFTGQWKPLFMFAEGRPVSIPSSSGHQFTGCANQCDQRWHGLRFNPFFIRASVYWTCIGPAIPSRALRPVSIPSSSGHQFTERPKSRVDDGVGMKFQSLLHQGISLLQGKYQLRKPRGVQFQSLLHQGISLLDGSSFFEEGNAFSVSIPSSSGHQFTALTWAQLVQFETDRFNPFFIRASVY